MLRAFRDRFSDFFQRTPETLDENHSIHDLMRQYPAIATFIERKYGLKIDSDDQNISLKEFCERNKLPPAPVVFMEVQLDQLAPKVTELPAPEVAALLKRDPNVRVLDVREEWETKLGKIPGSNLLTAALLDDILSEWEKNTPILVYCHHGVRSLDAAIFLADRGFTQMMTLRGGIDAWSTQVDPTVPKYDGQYC